MKHTIEEKLNTLLELQALDNDLDDIVKLQGALPEEVEELQDELTELQARLRNSQEGLTELKESITMQRSKSKETEALVKKYEDQQMNVRNNREYDAITKEIDLQKLEIQLAEKRIKSAYEHIEKQKLEIEHDQAVIEKKKQVLDDKKVALQGLVSESEGEKRRLQKRRKEVVQHIEEALLKTYEKIRSSVRNKLAIVTIKRDACGGCFNLIPPQKQVDIREKKRIIICEHCGRIIADVTDQLVVADYSLED